MSARPSPRRARPPRVKPSEHAQIVPCGQYGPATDGSDDGYVAFEVHDASGRARILNLSMQKCHDLLDDLCDVFKCETVLR